MNYIAVIPARKNSKGIKFKNRYKIKGESITRVAIKKAKALRCKYIVLTSDDEYLCKENQDIAFIVKRPSYLSDDKACSFDVWQHALFSLYRSKIIKNYEFPSILLEPTSPNRKISDLKRAIKLHIKHECNVLTLSRLNKSFSPEKIMNVDAKLKTTFYKKNGVKFLRRQTIKDYYYRNGICYIAKSKNILKKNPKFFFYNNCKSIIINRKIVNIDEKEDLKNLK